MKEKIHYGWFILILGMLTVFNSQGLARFGYTMILPSMQEGLALSNAQAGALATGNFCGYLALALVAGVLASRFSPRRVIVISLFIVGMTMVLTGTARGMISALIWRTLTGMGSGGCFVPTMGILAAWFAKKRRGMATGLAVGGSSIGLILTGPLVPYLLRVTGENGWRWAWAIIGGCALIFCGIVGLFLRDKPQDLCLMPLGYKGDNDYSAENKSSGWVEICKSKTVWHLAFIYSTYGFSYIIYVTFFAKYLQSEVGMTEEASGRLWLIVGWLSLGCGFLWGWVSDVLGRKQAIFIVTLLQGCAYMIFALWKTPGGALASSMIFGITAWSIPAIMAAACGDHLGSRLVPAALGFITLFFGIAQALGPWAAGMMADAYSSFSPALVAAAIIAWLGAADSLFLSAPK
ncbi:MAG TPA: YbfB/YjiJ family MFS transporter [Candidatus Sumerlaeota bacterium]|nr:YbfB/YjiJ family MFS transporter [Candidatus Sumerlaeota bacterium]